MHRWRWRWWRSPRSRRGVCGALGITRGWWRIIVHLRRHVAWRCSGAEGKACFVEHDMPRGDDSSRRDLVAAIATVIRRIADEDAWRRTRGEFVTRRGDGVGEAAVAKNAKRVVGRRCTEQQFVRCRGSGGSARTAVDQVCRRGERLGPKLQGSCTVNQQSSQTIVNST